MAHNTHMINWMTYNTHDVLDGIHHSRVVYTSLEMNRYTNSMAYCVRKAYRGPKALKTTRSPGILLPLMELFSTKQHRRAYM
eukprot:1160498-Pelagomonas_calceolata.AAC.5